MKTLDSQIARQKIIVDDSRSRMAKEKAKFDDADKRRKEMEKMNEQMTIGMNLKKFVIHIRYGLTLQNCLFRMKLPTSTH